MKDSKEVVLVISATLPRRPVRLVDNDLTFSMKNPLLGNEFQQEETFRTVLLQQTPMVLKVHFQVSTSPLRIKVGLLMIVG